MSYHMLPRQSLHELSSRILLPTSCSVLFQSPTCEKVQHDCSISVAWAPLISFSYVDPLFAKTKGEVCDVTIPCLAAGPPHCPATKPASTACIFQIYSSEADERVGTHTAATHCLHSTCFKTVLERPPFLLLLHKTQMLRYQEDRHKGQEVMLMSTTDLTSTCSPLPHKTPWFWSALQHRRSLGED